VYSLLMQPLVGLVATAPSGIVAGGARGTVNGSVDGVPALDTCSVHCSPSQYRYS
jgi:hypothetical protein